MAETKFIRTKKERNYTTLDNTFIRDTTLSWKAKGVMTYLLSLPDDWVVYLSEIQKHASDGRDSLRTAVAELLEKGYLVQTGGNTFDFFEKPRVAANVNQETRPATTQEEITADLTENEQAANDIDLANREINNSSNFLNRDINSEEDYINENDLYDEWIGANEPSDFDLSKGKPKQGEFVF